MRYRAFKVKATGEFVNILHTTAGDKFDVPAASHRDSLALAMGLRSVELETVEQATDPRTGVMVEQPVVIAPPNQEIESFMVATVDGKIKMLAEKNGLA